MKTKLTLAAIAIFCSVALQAQTLDEILAKYFENTGGIDKWRALKGIKMSAKVNQGGMEIPLEIVQLKDGRQMTAITFQGKVIKQAVYDGATLWNTNFMTMKAEKSDAESTEIFKASMADFPDPFLDYKTKGYKAELVGKETVEGTEAFKIKLIKKPITVDGKQEENTIFYFFDAENFVPIMTESEIKTGEGKGMISQGKYSDYQDVNGLMLPFSLSQGIKGSGSQALTITTIVLDPAVSDAEFKYPEGQ